MNVRAIDDAHDILIGIAKRRRTKEFPARRNLVMLVMMRQHQEDNSCFRHIRFSEHTNERLHHVNPGLTITACERPPNSVAKKNSSMSRLHITSRREDYCKNKRTAASGHHWYKNVMTKTSLFHPHSGVGEREIERCRESHRERERERGS